MLTWARLATARWGLRMATEAAEAHAAALAEHESGYRPRRGDPVHGRGGDTIDVADGRAPVGPRSGAWSPAVGAGRAVESHSLSGSPRITVGVRR